MLCTATPTYYGWLCSWNTTTVPNGSYILLSEAFSAGGSAFSSGVNVTVANPGLADLASSSVTGTISGSSGTGGCSFLEGIFTATYPGSSAVDTVTLQMDGCIPGGGGNFPFTFTYSGTFTITTGVGTLTGTVAGQINNVITSPVINVVPVTAALALTVTSGTGQFAGTTGTLNLGLQFPEPPAFVGTITPA